MRVEHPGLVGNNGKVRSNLLCTEVNTQEKYHGCLLSKHMPSKAGETLSGARGGSDFDPQAHVNAAHV